VCSSCTYKDNESGVAVSGCECATGGQTEEGADCCGCDPNLAQGLMPEFYQSCSVCVHADTDPATAPGPTDPPW
jgi:hypothetical protein